MALEEKAEHQRDLVLSHSRDGSSSEKLESTQHPDLATPKSKWKTECGFPLGSRLPEPAHSSFVQAGWSGGLKSVVRY